MRKEILTIAMVAAVASLSLMSCQKNSDTQKSEGDQEEQKQDQTPEKTAVITIDGEFEDWNSDDVVVSEEVSSQYPAIDVLKGYCDAENVYLYYHVADCDVFNNIRILIDTDDDVTTGTPAYGASTYVVSTGYSAMLNITSPLGYGSASPYSDMYGGDTAMNGAVSIKMKKSIKDSREAEFEMAMSRSSLETLIPFEADELRVCMFALDKSWAVNASIPSPESGEPLLIPVNND